MTYLVAAYSAFFLLVFVYLLRLATKQKDINRRLSDLQRNLDRDGRD